jgi:hypothetical protein
MYLMPCYVDVPMRWLGHDLKSGHKAKREHVSQVALMGMACLQSDTSILEWKFLIRSEFKTPTLAPHA